MEVAGQWRREWAGTAEYGKVTEGGVTRQVARAMEVLHASGPGARVRVLRAAYHSTAGAGAPAESFVMHSSRRVISSGSNFLDSPTFTSKRFEIPSKPFEISSTPLETTPERFSESENYKVTEPDDSEISEPSKWRSSTGTSLRIPSEESSSTADNVSIIDLDTKMNIPKHTDLLRKFSFDSDSSEVQSKSSNRRNSTRASPLLDIPVTLSTLKYKSLLNGSNDSWNDRRKSYSFEDTSPLNETILHKNDTLAMDSSTDSGICKSTEIVNESVDERVHHIHINKTEEDIMYEPREGTFKDWLARNRHYNETPLKSYRDNYIIEEPSEDNISLQSPGKVLIALPVNNQIEDKFQYMKNHFHSEVDRRIKKVEFCKTELHFAAETGKVNIIATDEKPPSSSDFRRKRSAFVPLKSSFDKPVVTLFGEKLEDCPFSSEPDSNGNYEVDDSDENTAATKSILKNKIPKPKPYLLGENMIFGEKRSGSNVASPKEYIIPTTISLINKQLQPEEKRTEEISSLSNTKARSKIETHNSASVLNTVSRPINEGPLYDNAVNNVENQYFQRFKSGRNSFREDFKNNNYNAGIKTNNTNLVKQKLRTFQTSPVMQVKPKTRNLRENELTYFGVDSLKKNQVKPKEEKATWLYNNRQMPIKLDNDLQSIKLIKHISNSVCNSETESDDTPEYQNIPLRTDFAPVPIPKTRTKGVYDFQIKPDEVRSERVVIIKPIVEQSYQVRDTNIDQDTRQTRHRRLDISTTTFKSRSISEPPKYRLEKEILPKKSSRDQKRILDIPYDSASSPQPIRSIRNNVEKIAPLKYLSEQEKPEEEALYVNGHIDKEENLNEHGSSHKKAPEPRSRSRQRKSSADRRNKEVRTIETESNNKKDKDSIKSSRQKKSTEKQSGTNKNKTDSDTANKSINPSNKKSKRTSPVETQEMVFKKSDKSPVSESKRHVSGSEHTLTPTDSQEKRKEDKHEPRRKRSNRIDDKSLDREVKLEKPKPHRHDRSKSKDILGSKQNNMKTSDRHHHSQTRTSKRNGVDSDTSSKDKHKRSEYVINYDDKNGTVSSICKVKPGTSKKMIIHPEKTKEMQYQEPQWIPYGSVHRGDKKWKNKVYIQRNCQLL